MLKVMHQWHALIMTKSCGHGYMNKTNMLRASLMPLFLLLPTDWMIDFFFPLPYSKEVTWGSVV